MNKDSLEWFILNIIRESEFGLTEEMISLMASLKVDALRIFSPVLWIAVSFAAMIEPAINTVIYYFHERVWQRKEQTENYVRHNALDMLVCHH